MASLVVPQLTPNGIYLPLDELVVKTLDTSDDELMHKPPRFLDILSAFCQKT